MSNFVYIDPVLARESFYINDDWELVWKERPLHHFKNEGRMKSFNTRYSGKVAGYNRKFKHTSYKLLKYNGLKLSAHRLIWAVYYGENPSGVIDHKDHNGLNNNINNLRLCTMVQNNLNKKGSKFTGVYYSNKKEKWVARIRKKSHTKRIRYFVNESDAIKQRLEWEKEFGIERLDKV